MEVASVPANCWLREHVEVNKAGVLAEASKYYII